MLDIYLITNVLYNINCKRFKKHILCVFWQNYCKKWGYITIINLPADGTLPTDIVCSHNRNRFHDTPFHHHSHHIELYLFISGNVTFFTKNEAFPLKRGYLIAIPDGVWHRAVTRDDVPYERIFLNIDIDLIKQLSTPKTDLYRCFDVSDPKEINILNLGSDAFDDYVNFCDELIPTLDKDTYGNDIHQRILLAEILLLANKVHKIKKQPRNIIPPFLEKVTHFIDENLADDLSLAAFSKHFYLNSPILTVTSSGTWDFLCTNTWPKNALSRLNSSCVPARMWPKFVQRADLATIVILFDRLINASAFRQESTEQNTNQNNRELLLKWFASKRH